VVWCDRPPKLGENEQDNERDPEEAVRHEGNHWEHITLSELEDSSDDLSRASIAKSHCKDHGVHGENSSIVQVEKECGQPETEKAKWCGISCAIFNGDDALALLKRLCVNDIVNLAAIGNIRVDLYIPSLFYIIT
jgi:hypothetical protein